MEATQMSDRAAGTTTDDTNISILPRSGKDHAEKKVLKSLLTDGILTAGARGI